MQYFAQIDERGSGGYAVSREFRTRKSQSSLLCACPWEHLQAASATQRRQEADLDLGDGRETCRHWRNRKHHRECPSRGPPVGLFRRRSPRIAAAGRPREWFGHQPTRELKQYRPEKRGL